MTDRWRIPASFFIVIFLDQLTKILIESRLAVGDVISVVPGFFNIILTYNPGAAFGIMSGLPDSIRYVALAATTVIALGAVLYFFIKEYRHDIVAQMALAGVLGGAVGNIIDRVRLGMVVDFLDVYFGSYHWPAFNIADSAICLGVFVIVFRRPHRVASSNLLA